MTDLFSPVDPGLEDFDFALSRLFSALVLLFFSLCQIVHTFL